MKKIMSILNGKKIYLAIIVSVLLLLLFIIIYPTKVNDIASAADLPLSIDSYTDSDFLIGDSITIKEYSNLRQLPSLKTADNGIKELTSFYDDKIIKIVPKNLFAKRGQYTYIGKEYGFYINTEPCTFDYDLQSLYELEHNNISTVIVFDLTDTYNKNSDIFTTKLDIIFQYQYVYISKLDDHFWLRKGDGSRGTGGNISPNYRVNYTGANADYVMPLGRIINNFTGEISYSALDYYFLKDVTFAGKLYNEQALNVGDNEYQAIHDKGSFFTRTDYIYNGQGFKNGKKTSEAIVPIIKDSFTFVIGNIPVIDKIYNAINSTINIIEDIKSANVTLTPNVSNDNYIAKCNNTTHDLQIANDKFLVKFSSTQLNTNSKNTLVFGNNDNVRQEFTISDGAFNAKKNKTRIVRHVSLKIVDKNLNIIDLATTEDKGVEKINFINDDQYENLNLSKNSSVYLLQNGSNTFKFKPQYSGNYNIKLNTTDAVELYMNGVKQTLNNNACTIRLTANQEKKFEVRKKGAGCITTINITPSTTLKNLSINPNEQFIVKLPTNMNAAKLLTIKNGTAMDNKLQIAKVLKLNESGALADASVPALAADNMLSAYFGSGNYYAVIKNSNTAKCTANLTIANVPTLSISDQANDKSINSNLKSNNYSWFKIQADNSTIQNYALSVTNASNMQFKLIDSVIKAELVMDNNFSYGYSAFGLVKGRAYYLGIKNGKNSSSSIKIQKANTAYQWDINGKRYSTSSVELLRGATYTIKLYINGQVSTSLIKMRNQGTNDGQYKCTFDNAKSALTITDGCQIGGNGVLIISSNYNLSNNPEDNFDPILSVIPKFDPKTIKIAQIYNNDDLGFNFIYKKYVASINYSIYATNIPAKTFKFNFNLTRAQNANLKISLLQNVKSFDSYNYKSPYFKLKLSNVTIKDAFGNLKNFGITDTEWDIDVWFGGEYLLGEDVYIFGAPVGRVTVPQISCVRHFNNLTKPYESFFAIVVQTADIDFKGGHPTPGIKCGVYAGMGHTIKNITFDENKKSLGNLQFVGGLFSEVYFVQDLNIVNLNMTFKSDTWNKNYVIGGVAGKSEIIKNVTVSGNIKAMRNNWGALGGIVGHNNNEMENCTSSVNIQAYGDIGGVAGINKGSMINCTYNGSLHFFQALSDGNKSGGGIAGYSIGAIVNSHGNGKIYYANDIRSESNKLAPALGKVVGFNGSEQTRGVCENCNGTGSVNIGNLHTVTYYKFPRNRTWNQAQYAGNRLVGRQD